MRNYTGLSDEKETERLVNKLHDEDPEFVGEVLKDTQAIMVNVLQEDIDHGVPNNSRFCPIGNALLRMYIPTRPYLKVEVHPRAIQIEEATKKKGLSSWWVNHTVNLPRQVRQFIDDFDCGKEVKPFSFNLSNAPKL